MNTTSGGKQSGNINTGVSSPHGLIDPTDFTKEVLIDCNVMVKPHIQRQPMLRKGSSIHRLCEEHPSYAQAVPRTFYGKNNLIGPGTTRDALNNDS